MTTYYEFLQVSVQATPAELDAAYQCTLDAILGDGQPPEARADQLQALEEAYATLRDPDKRAAYDRGLAGSEASLLPAMRDDTPGLPTLAQALPATTRACPHCGAPNPSQAMNCLSCGKQVARSCPRCGHLVTLGQVVCQHCQTIIHEYDGARFSETKSVEERVQSERRESKVRVAALEASNKEKEWRAAVLWFLIVVVSIALLALAVHVFNRVGG